MIKHLVLVVAAFVVFLGATTAYGDFAPPQATTRLEISNLQVTGGGVSGVDFDPYHDYVYAMAYARTLLTDLGPDEGTVTASQSVTDAHGAANGAVSNALPTGGTATALAESRINPTTAYREALTQDMFTSYFNFYSTANQAITIAFDAGLLLQRNLAGTDDGYAYNFSWFRLDFYEADAQGNILGFMGRWAPSITANTPGFEDYWDETVAAFPDSYYGFTNVTTSEPFSLNVFGESWAGDAAVSSNDSGAFSLSFTAPAAHYYSVDIVAAPWAFVSGSIVPEPISLVFFGTGIVGVMGFVARKRMC